MNFRLVLEGKTGKEIPELSRLQFFEKFFQNIYYCRFGLITGAFRSFYEF